MLNAIYLLFFESVLILGVRCTCTNIDMGSFIYNDELDGKKCSEAELMFIKLGVSRIRCSAHCIDDSRCKSIFYNDQTRSCFGCTELYTAASNVVAEPGAKYFGIKIDETLPSDCKGILESVPDATTGVYSILPLGETRRVKVLCDMDTDGGGWTVFQHRFDGTVNFERLMVDYVRGFGCPTGEYWLGFTQWDIQTNCDQNVQLINYISKQKLRTTCSCLKHIRSLTKNISSTIHVEFVDADDAVAIEIASSFRIDDAPYYRIHIGAAVFYNDSSDELILQRLDQRKFSTIDQDNDGSPKASCAKSFKSGWWFHWCTFINVNGEYITPGTVSNHFRGRGGMTNEIWRGRAGLKGTKLMFRRDT